MDHLHSMVIGGFLLWVSYQFTCYFVVLGIYLRLTYFFLQIFLACFDHRGTPDKTTRTYELETKEGAVCVSFFKNAVTL
jgi:hypothetical protein